LKNLKTILLASTVALCTISGTSFAADQSNDQAPSPFKGSSVAGGGIINTGNTQSKSLNFNTHLIYSLKKWIHTFDTSYQYANTKDKGTTSNQFYAQEKSKFKLSDLNFVYGSVDYTNNRFDGYDYIVNLNTGYGRNIQMPETMSLDVFVGPGVRLDKQQSTKKSRTIGMVQLGSTYGWDITDETSFSEGLTTNISKKTVDTTSVTALTTSLNSHLKFSVNYELDHTSKPVDDKKSLNTITSLNLIYSL